jgi:hypothetical protein
MNEQLPIDAEALIDEITRYLAVVEVFRATDCEPTWRPEYTTPVLDVTRAVVPTHLEQSAH